MAWSEQELICKKHPDQRQQPGVCSSCLREKLSNLPSFTFTVVPPRSASVPSSPAACHSSAPSSTCMSPTRHAHHRNSSAIVGSSAFGSNGRNGLRKSKSITYIARRRVRNGVEGKKKEGFWSKLLRSTSLKTRGVFVYSKTQKKESTIREIEGEGRDWC